MDPDVAPNSERQEQGVYQVLARRTRPQAFSELVGQNVVSTALASMISSGVIPHAFLFTGTRGTGKTSSARILAKSLCCIKGPTAEPCQVCVHCRQITECAHDDILEIDGASNTGVDHVRELRESARFYPNSARYKVFIIDEVHMLTQQAFNALLKTLEEPPPQVVFILATTELHKVPLTVRSRCVTFSFRKVPPEVISEHLARILEREGVGFDLDALALIAREAKGSIRDSLSLLEQVRALCGGRRIETQKTREALNILGQEMAEQLLSSIATGNATAALDILRDADAASMDLALLMDDAAALFRSAMVLRVAKNDDEARRLTQLLPSEMEALRQSTQALPVGALSEIFRVLSLGAREVGRAPSGLPWAEIFVLDCVTRRDWLSASELLGVLEQKKNLSAETSTSAAPIPSGVSPSAQPQPPPPPPGTSSAAGKFQAVVRMIEGKNLRLSNKLKQATLVCCNDERLEFAVGEQNRIYTTLNANEATVFFEALESCGMAHLAVKGLQLPSDFRRQAPAGATLPAPPPTPATPVVQPMAQAQATAPTPPPLRQAPTPSPQPARPQPPPPVQRAPERPQPQSAREPEPQPAQAGPRSVADLEKNERIKAQEEKRQRILRDPQLQDLIAIGSEPQVLPLDDEE